MKKSFIKFYIFLFSFIFVCANVYSVPRKIQKGQEAWRSLKKAQDAFEANDFASAIKFCELAKQTRKDDVEWQTYILEGTLKKNKVRHAGDNLERVIPVLKDLELFDAISIVDFHVEKFGIDYFNNSYSEILAHMPDYSQYPEVDYLLGKIYRLEGELNVAFNYMERAYQYSENLDIPMEKYDLLYDLASLSTDLGNEENYEKFLLAVASDESLFQDKGYINSALRIINADNNDSSEKFFLLYRCENDIALKAFMDLGKFYIDKGENEKALKFVSFASVIAITKIESVLKQRKTEFVYKNLQSLLSLCSKYDDIVEWGNKNGVWELFCNFADVLYSNGKVTFARNLYITLSNFEPEVYWKKYASNKIITESF